MPKVERRAQDALISRHSRSMASHSESKLPPLRYERSRCLAADAERKMGKPTAGYGYGDAMPSSGFFLTAPPPDDDAGVAVEAAVSEVAVPPRRQRARSSGLLPSPDPQLAAVAEAASEAAGATATKASSLLDDLLLGRISIATAAAASAAAAAAADEAWVVHGVNTPRHAAAWPHARRARTGLVRTALPCCHTKAYHATVLPCAPEALGC